jgi:hypothetical protein
MKRYSKPGARGLAGALALVMVFVFAAPPAGAAEGTAEAQPSTTDNPQAEQPTLLAMAEAKVRAADPAKAQAVPPAEETEIAGDKPFLKSPQGILAVSLLVAGTIFVAYSRSNDRPTSPVR